MAPHGKKRTVKKPRAAQKRVPTRVAKRSPRSVVAGLPVSEEPVPDLRYHLPPGKKWGHGENRIWDSEKVVEWVCGEMAQGKIITHILSRIPLPFITFLEYVDSTPALAKRYAKARKAEARAVAALARATSNGVDAISDEWARRMEAILTRAMRGKKSVVHMLRAQEQIKELERNRIQRNRLQVDTLKWYAKITDPDTFGDKTQLGVDMPNGEPLTIRVEFVEPEHKA